ncbi:MAG: hypothetical protein HY929_00950 [Euryarchaeota archaeon]|nr:hypothetical protein [Euryarchaeota archaeon]
MVFFKEAIVLVWVLGVGIGAILSAIILITKKAENWSAIKIVTFSLTLSTLIAVFFIYLLSKGG